MTRSRKKCKELMDMLRKCNDEVDELIIQHACVKLEDSVFREKMDTQIKKVRDVRMKLVAVRTELLTAENML